jgi:hypothetical protein
LPAGVAAGLNIGRIEAAVFSALLAIFLCRTVVANAIVPPWQGPDEPTHFALAYGLTMPTMMQGHVEGGVIRSMVEHGWWELYDDPPPNPLPTSLGQLYGIGPGTLAQPLYYGTAAALLRITRPVDLESAYRHLRALSVVLAVLVLVFGWLGTRLVLGPDVALGATTIGALHPQFLLASISVNADSLLNVCGAFVWWQGARVVAGQHRAFSTVLMIVGAVAAVFTKRLGLVVAGVAVVVAVGSLLTSRGRRLQKSDLILGSAALGIALVVATGTALLLDTQVEAWMAFLADALTVSRPAESTSLQESVQFLRMTMDYFWLIAGWLRFQPPDWWTWIARVLIVAGLAGAAVVFFEASVKRGPLALAWLFVGAQVSVMLFAVFWTIPSAPQARYLFPVFAPITALLYVGLCRMGRAWPQQWPVILVLGLAILDVTGFTTVHIPAYLR